MIAYNSRDIMVEDGVANNGIQPWDNDKDALHRNMILRLGSQIRLSDIASIPETYQDTPDQLNGRLGSIYLNAEASDIWCRINGGISSQVWPPAVKHIEARIFPLHKRQSTTPPPNAIELLPQMAVLCEEGKFGKLTGILIDTRIGKASSLLVHVRSNNDAFLSKSGDTLLVPPNWVAAPNSAASLQLKPHQLLIDASVHQIAHGMVLRDDAEIMQDVWTILGKNPALQPYVAQMHVHVMDGSVSITGPALSPRLRSSLEQEIWHIPGVFNLRNLIRQD